MVGVAAVAALCIAACGKPPGSEGGVSLPSATTRASDRKVLVGEAIAFRFADHAGEAAVEGDLVGAWRSIEEHPQRSLLPYGRLAGEAAFRVVQMAFSDADVRHYPAEDEDVAGGKGGDGPGDGHGDPEAKPRAAHPVRRLDAVWNRERAVYLSRQALYLPAGATQRYRVRVPRAARLETALGLLGPRGAAARFRITVDDRAVLDEEVGVRETWIKRSVDLAGFGGREATVVFSVVGAGDAKENGDAANGLHGFFADPLLYAKGELPGPSVLFVLVDTLRADALPVMPRLQALAKSGARFDQAITAATWTRPSMLAMYGGDLPTAVGQTAERMIPRDADRRRFYRLAPPLLPRLLAARGFRTAAIGNNFFLLTYPAIGLDLGFEQVDDVRHPVEDTPAITRAAIRFLEENRDRAFFLHLHYDAPHWPYTPPAEYRTRARAQALLAAQGGDAALQKDPLFARYLGEAAYADDNLGEVLDALSRLGMRERTLVIVVGDHGEIFDPAHDHTVDALGFRTLHHHGWSAYDELLRVPLVVAMPGAVAPVPVEIRTQVRLYDLAPTILDYLDVPGSLLPERGRSLRSLIEGRESADRVAFAEGQDIRAVRGEGYLYLSREDPRLHVKGRATLVPEELYDLAADPLQHENLVETQPQARAKMRALFLREAPVSPEVKAVVYHLRIAPDTRAHRIDGTIRVGTAGTGAAGESGMGTTSTAAKRASNATWDREGDRGGVARVAVRWVSGGEVEAVDGHTLKIRIAGAGGIDFTVDPPEAALSISLARDGVPIDLGRVLVGEFALPLLDGALAGERLSRLDARRPPEPGTAGEVLLFRDPGAITEPPPELANASDTDEVRGMMERWGYAQPAAKKSE